MYQVMCSSFRSWRSVHLYPSWDKEVHKDGLDLRLSWLEIIPSQKHLLLLGQLHHSWNKCILWRPIDVGALDGGKREEWIYSNLNMQVPHPLHDTGNGKESGRRHFLCIASNGVEQIVCCVIETSSHFTEPLSVGCPQDNHLINGRKAKYALAICICIRC